MKSILKIMTSLVLMPLMALADGDLYMVVDLSGGTTATSYPISYLSDVPDGGWSDEYKTTKLVLRRIDPGTCVVTVDKPYYIGVFEVTQKQYELITGANPSYFTGNDKRPVEQVSYDMLRGASKGAQYPDSTDVDDDSFMGKMRVRTAFRFDLPTESQWEYACRAGTTTTYSYGDNANGDYMWYRPNSGSCSHDVGTRTANAWGLYDMHGNICEFCLNWSTEVGYEDCRVLRSGAWYFPADGCTTVHFFSSYSSDWCERDGFRLVANIDSTLSDGLVAWYKFDGDAKDSSTNGNDGVVYGATLTIDRFGNANSAYVFDGVDDWVSVAHNNTLSATNLTVSVWIKPHDWYHSNGNWIPIVCKADCSYKEGSYRVDIGKNADGSYDYHSVISWQSITFDCWQHLTYVISNSNWKVYRNGLLIGENPNGDLIRNYQDALALGRDIVGAMEYFNGTMDDVRIYNRALSAAEIKALYEFKEDQSVWKVAFDACGGVASENAMSVTNGMTIGELPVAERGGHKFLGWFTERDEGAKITSETIITSNATFYAHWFDTSIENVTGTTNVL